MENRMSRRRTLQLFGVGLAVGGGLLACKDNKPAGGDAPKPTGAGATASCDATVDDTSKATRKTLQYKDEATTPDKRCIACAQYTEKTFGDCGGCKLFAGPVKPNGGCLGFAPKGAAEGGAAPAKSG